MTQMHYNAWSCPETTPNPESLSTAPSFGYAVFSSHHIDRGPYPSADRPEGLVLITLSGQMHARHGEADSLLTKGGPGSITLFPPGTWQHYGSQGKWEKLWFHLFPSQHLWQLLESQDLANYGKTWPNLLPADERKSLYQILDYPHQYQGQALTHWVGLYLEQLLSRCLHASVTASPPDTMRLSDVAQMMRLSPEQPHQVSDFAAMAHLSVSRFAHLFREEYGVSPKAYLMQCRMEQAMELLRRSHLNAAEVGRKVGFNSPYTFYTAFKREVGISPKRYAKLADSETNQYRLLKK